MTKKRIYEVLAEDFVAEGVDTLFTLMGTANMHWATALQNMPGMRTIRVRHEHNACTAAMGYHSATGKVGVASVTCGPGFTQTMTALTSAVRNHVPLVIFVGEPPIGSPWYEQGIDLAPFAAACGARYIAGHAAKRMHGYVQEAFHYAKLERRPVVLGVPYDLQKEYMPDIGPYVPSTDIDAVTLPIPPHPTQIDEIARLLAQAKCPVLVAGKGAVQAGAENAIEELADASGALLATTLLARGAFDHHPYSLGVAGGFAREIGREMFGQADLIVAFGASLSTHTADAGRLYPKARIVQITVEPQGFNHGRRVADIYLQADARLAAIALAEAVRGTSGSADVRSPELAERIRTNPADSADAQPEAGTLDPREVHKVLEHTVPHDFDVVSGTGHYAYFHTPMRGVPPSLYHSMRSFGAVGNALGYAMGIAVARNNGKVVLYDGDGGLAMCAQEFETLKREGIKILIICANDGAYGSEVHKLRGDGVDDSGSLFGRPDFESIAKGFGLRGATVTNLARLETMMQEYDAEETAQVWNVHVADNIISPYMRTRVKTDKQKAKELETAAQ